ncbi:hypothetical protein CIK05_00790 [Bdellovibrio sp. qaytius]|nr:hypothetical protein CIK05_00790 [Bdellovibrio sp. qaytius]
MTTTKSDKRPALPRKRYKNEFFLKALGNHCRKLRLQKGFSIDRLAKEADQLSPASIDRLEKGTADSQILVLLRYAEALSMPLLDLLSFLKDMPNISKDPRVIPYEEDFKPPTNYIPVYPIKVAAGKFSDNETYSDTAPLGWVELNLKAASSDYFAAYVQGESMQPRIKNGDLCLFRKYTGGSRQGKVFLIQARSLRDPETAEGFVIKKYVRQTPARAANEYDEEQDSVIHLVSENSRFSPIILYGLKDDDVQTIAEFIKIL